MSYTEIANAARAAAYSESDISPPPVYAEIAIAAPAVYAEAPSEDLVAELAKMKAMMEQMRLDKERLEADAKRKAEEEAAATLRAKQEIEAAVKLQKEKKELDAVFKIFTDSSWGMGKWSDDVWEFAGKMEIQFLRALEAAGETLLLVHLDHPRYGNWDSTKPKHVWSISIILTNRHLYRLQYKSIEKVPTSDEFYSSKLYSFANPLNLAQAKLLSSIMKVPKEDEYCLSEISIWQRVSYSLRDGGTSYFKHYVQGMKNFESVIRLIPGSYKNGSWRQLDGFFGMYFNEATMEVSEVPPPSL
jgi:hypothetical protein